MATSSSVPSSASKRSGRSGRSSAGKSKGSTSISISSTSKRGNHKVGVGRMESSSTRSAHTLLTSSTAAAAAAARTQVKVQAVEEDHPDLVEWEERLNQDVDEEFFNEPKKFHTLHRVIDVLGSQLDHTHLTSPHGNSKNQNGDQQAVLDQNPAYQELKHQQTLVEEAIEHLALIHCADLNGSVVQVGRVARQFQDAVTQVRHLRSRVQEIQETLGADDDAAAGSGTGTTTQEEKSQILAKHASASAQSAMSLRELWLKKLEAEAVLSLLEKLDKIRAAPRMFDIALQEQRMGAAVLIVSSALDTMFSSDVSQVQALHKIMEQLMMRKQKAEELVWEVLLDVLFLRTGNISNPHNPFNNSNSDNSIGNSKTNSSSSNNKMNSNSHASGNIGTANMVNPFWTHSMRFAMEQDLHVESAAAIAKKSKKQQLDGSLVEDWQQDEQYVSENMMIPPSILEAEFDLESEERGHLEELKQIMESDDDDDNLFFIKNNNKNNDSNTANGGTSPTMINGNYSSRTKPQYGDALLALRTLVECLSRLNRLDDVERLVLEAIPKEIEALLQREQARTFLVLEQSSAHLTTRHRFSSTAMARSSELQDFRRHLHGIISAFGNVQLRLSYLAQILRHKMTTEKRTPSTTKIGTDGTTCLASVIETSREMMEKELKEFLDSCLQPLEEPEPEPEFNIHALTNVSGQSRQIAAKNKKQRESMGLFSLGIVESNKNESAAMTAEAWLTASTTSKRTQIEAYETKKFVLEILFAKTTHSGTPQVRHALFFRRALDQWHHDSKALRRQLSQVTNEAMGNSDMQIQPALEYLDVVIQKDLLPILQEEAVNGTVQALERPDAFDPVLERNVYHRKDSNEPQDVDMCRACNALYQFTGPLFLALHRLPKGGEMYLPLVAVLEHVILTFTSRVKQQVQRLCQNRTALQLMMDNSTSSSGTVVGADGKSSSSVTFGVTMERRKAYAQLILAYADGDLMETAAVTEQAASGSGVPLLAASANDSPNKQQLAATRLAALGMDDLDFIGGVEREEMNLSNELVFVRPFLEFAGMDHSLIRTCTDEILMKSACLAHSLLKLASLLDARLKVRSVTGGIATKTLSNTRALREAIKTIKANGLRMAKFCRADVLLQAITRLSKVCNSSTVVARDAVRIPSSVNDLGEYMTAASDNLREAAGNAVTAFAFSTLEQYIPLCLIQTVRVLAAGKGIVTKAPLTMNGIEALDRSGSVLYRDLKGATSFDNSFWDIELAAVSFERSASFIAMMELEMTELEAYYQENHEDFSEQDFQLMFGMNGPRRKGDIGRYHMLVKRLDNR